MSKSIREQSPPAVIFFFDSLVVVEAIDDGGDEGLALDFSSVRSSSDLVKTHPVNATTCSSLSFATSSATHIPATQHIMT